MKLWLLERIDGRVGYDECAGFVVRAASEQDARAVAQVNGAHEVHAFSGPRGGRQAVSFWTDPEKTSCSELTSDGPEALILTDFNAA